MAQLHMIIMRKGRVVRGISSIKLNQFEENIRDFIRNEFYNNGMIKVWYFNIDDSPINPKNIPLRIAVTFDIGDKDNNEIDNTSFKEKIYQYVKALL